MATVTLDAERQADRLRFLPPRHEARGSGADAQCGGLDDWVRLIGSAREAACDNYTTP